MSGEVWTQIYDRLAQLVGEHRTTLVFVNTRRQAERVARHLSERLGEEHVTAHHGSLAKESRLDAEQRLKAGRAARRWWPPPRSSSASTSATSTSCARSPRRARSPRSCSASGAPATPSAARPRDGCSRCRATTWSSARRCWRRCGAGSSTACACRTSRSTCWRSRSWRRSAAHEWDSAALFALCRGAYPYRELSARGVRRAGAHAGRGLQHPPRPPRRAHPPRRRQPAHPGPPRRAPHRDHLRRHHPRHRRLPGDARAAGAVRRHGERGLRGREPAGRHLPARQSSRTASCASSRAAVRVEDAHGEPPSIPFWLGEAPGRTDELSASVSRAAQRARGTPRRRRRGARCAWLVDGGRRSMRRRPCSWSAYLAAARAALGALPTRAADRARALLRRGGRHAARHPLAVRQPHQPRLGPGTAQALLPLVQLRAAGRGHRGHHRAVADDRAQLRARPTWRATCIPTPCGRCWSRRCCAAPMFAARWRWDATIALALPRFRGGKKVPAPLARMAAEDCLTAMFPDQVACAENLPGELEIPDHPLVRQTIRDCLEEAMDIEGFERLLRGLEAGEHPLSWPAISPSPRRWRSRCSRRARTPILDDAPLEERRTQAVMQPPLARPAERRRPRQARRRGHSAGARRGLAGRHRRRRAARCAAVARRSSPRPRRRRRPGWPALLASWPRQRRVTLLR